MKDTGLPLPSRRCLSRIEAAAYIGVSVPLFTRMVREGRMPSPVMWGGKSVWDVKAIDASLDRQSGLTGEFDGLAADRAKAREALKRLAS